MTMEKLQLSIDELNRSLGRLQPREILRWAKLTLPNLYQTTAFGLTGMVIIDMLSKMDESVPLIFVDTLYHFKETIELVEKVQKRYQIDLQIYRPSGVNSTAEFEQAYGSGLWERDEIRYDYLVKVEPARRAYEELNANAVITGRRSTQGGSRSTTPVIELDETGLIKINPLANWTFAQVNDYIKQNFVPYNALLDQGYRSVGDWHSTTPIAEGEDERAGRWRGREKTECGLHENYFAIKQAQKVAERQQSVVSAS